MAIRESVIIEIRAAEGGDDSKLLCEGALQILDILDSELV